MGRPCFLARVSEILKRAAWSANNNNSNNSDDVDAPPNDSRSPVPSFGEAKKRRKRARKREETRGEKEW